MHVRLFWSRAFFTFTVYNYKTIILTFYIYLVYITFILCVEYIRPLIIS